ALLMERGATRDRLTPGVYPGRSHEGLGRVEHAFALVHEVAPLKRKVRDAGHGNDWPGAVAAGVLTPGEAARLAAADEAVRAAITVDDFAPQELAALATIRIAAAVGSGKDRQPAAAHERPAWIAESI
ncbi:MAG: acyl-CoA dehydrogenase domain-containing protein, partial [Burkholderiales bacterium]